MLVRVKATVEAVGEAEELVDIRRPYRVGAVIGALMEELERAHPGVSLLEHVLTFESKPTKGKPDGTVSSGDAASKEIATPVELPASSVIAERGSNRKAHFIEARRSASR